jgi:hypothetical protein
MYSKFFGLRGHGIMTLATLAASVVLGQKAPVLTKSTIVDATLFKNGTAVTIHQVRVPASGEVLVEEPPMAALGTLWVYGNEIANIKGVVMTSIANSFDYDIDARDMISALSFNKGKTLQLTYMDGTEKKEMTGVLDSISEQFAVMTVKKGVQQVIRSSSILSFMGENLVFQAKGKQIAATPALRVVAEPGAMIYIMGLQSGLSWVPAYQVDLVGEGNLKITAKATIVNDLGDLDGIPTRLVTGVPNFSTLTTFDPLTYVYQMIQSGGQGGGGGFAGGGVGGGSAAGLSFSREAGADASFGSFKPQTGEGFSGEDLFFQPLENVKLKRGERGYYVLFNTASDFRHVYVLNLPNSQVDAQNRQPNPEEATVWHKLEFKNSMKQPWTTGSAMILQNGKMLGMDELKYTSPGSEATLKISKALDISFDYMEEETARDRKALQLGWANVYYYDLVTVKAAVELKNTKSLPVEMRVTKQVEGEVTESAGSYAVKKTTKQLNQVNPVSALEWRPVLAAGETKKFEFTYQVYVPAR